MIVGGYTLDLYCANEGKYPDGIHEFREFPHTFFDEYGSYCRRQARAKGWKLNLQAGTALCPKCSGIVPKS